MGATTTGSDLTAVKIRQQAAWSAGDYRAVGVRLALLGEQLCEAADVRAGESVLDIACGNGNAALAASRRFARVTGVDYVPVLLAHAAERARVEGLEATFLEGDAEDLRFQDSSFDVVLSAIGAMFSPDQERTASEMLRVCRPGGRIAMANWCHDGFVGELFRTIGGYLPPPPGLQPPTLWGTEDRVRQLLGGAETVRCERRTFFMHFRSATHYVEFMADHYGPMLKAFEAVGDTRRNELAADLEGVAERYNRGGAGALKLECDWLSIVADG
jgi:SAM-dependent methyltransferase